MLKWVITSSMAVVLLALMAGCGSSSGSAAASPPAQNGAVANGACNRLATEDLTVTNLAGISVAAHVVKDCGVQMNQGISRCKVSPSQAFKGITQQPWTFSEAVGFDAGLNHYDLLFQALWWDPPPFVIAIPGTGPYQTGNQPHGGTAMVNMYGGLKAGARATMGWQAVSGQIQFNSEIDPNHPLSGGSLDVQMTSTSAGAKPVHISGTWNAEQPCSLG